MTSIASINFFTPISYKNTEASKASPMEHSLYEMADEYFFFGGSTVTLLDSKDYQNTRSFEKEEERSLISTVIKVISYVIFVIPLIALAIKFASRYLSEKKIEKLNIETEKKLKTLDAETELNRGITITDDIEKKIAEVIQNFPLEKDHKDYEYLAYRVFKLRSNDDFVFKFGASNSDINERYSSMLNAKEVCLTEGLDRLYVPQSKKFTVTTPTKTYEVIAEKSVGLSCTDSYQEQMYKTAKNTDEAFKQLVKFIAKTGYSDVEWRNNPLDQNGNIALVDLEQFHGPEKGIYGGLSRGLVHSMPSERQMDMVIKEAQSLGIHPKYESVESLKNRRLQEIESEKKLVKYYKDNGIDKEPRKKIDVKDLSSLNLGTEKSAIKRGYEIEGGKLKRIRCEVSLTDVAADVIKDINEQLEKSSERESTKGKRYLLLETNHGNMSSYGQDDIETVVNALVDKNHLFKHIKTNGHGVFIQA